MVVEGILERNRDFVRGRAPAPIPDSVATTLAVVACYDPRLDALLYAALGLDPGAAFLLRAAGAHVAAAGDPLRSLAMATYVFGVTEVLVVGHTSCRMAQFPTTEFANAFRARGVSREAFGAGDLRTWAGAIPTPRSGVLASVAAIRSAPVMPRDLAVTGVVLDDTSGGLQVVIAAGESLTGLAVEPPAPPQPAPAPAPLPAHESARPEEAAGDESADAPAAPASPRAKGAVDAALSLVGKLRSKAVLRDEAMRLRLELGATKNPIEKLRLVEGFLRRAGGDAAEVRAAVEDLRRQANNTPPAQIAEDVARRVTRLSRED